MVYFRCVCLLKLILHNSKPQNQMWLKHKPFPFCFTKISKQAFYTTQKFDSEVSLHYWLLWPTVGQGGIPPRPPPSSYWQIRKLQWQHRRAALILRFSDLCHPWSRLKIRSLGFEIISQITVKYFFRTSNKPKINYMLTFSQWDNALNQRRNNNDHPSTHNYSNRLSPQ